MRDIGATPGSRIGSEKLQYFIYLQVEMQRIKQFFRQFDTFAALPTLRAKADNKVSSTCGGVLSLLILIGFTFIFINLSVKTGMWQDIKANVRKSEDFDEPFSITNITLGVGIYGMNMSDSLYRSYFSVDFYQISIDHEAMNIPNMTALESQPCDKSMFRNIDQNLDENYRRLDVANKICLKQNQQVLINTPFNVSENSHFLIIMITACRNGSDVICANSSQISEFFQDHISTHYYFTTQLVFVDTAFSPTEPDPTYNYLNSIRGTFTASKGTQAYISLSPYKINTDVSLFPIVKNNVEQNYFYSSLSSSSYEIEQHFPYINFIFQLINEKTIIDREVGKLDQVLSYVGGLLSIVVAFFACFMLSFNQYRYELLVGEGAFNYSDDGRKIRESDFNYCLYVKYVIFDWIKSLFCYEPDWRDCREVKQTREEANQQLDVTLLLKKMHHLEKVVEYLINDKENISLYLAEPPSIEEVRKTRLIAEYYDKIIQGHEEPTIEDVKILPEVKQEKGEKNPQIRILNQKNSGKKLHEKPSPGRQDILATAIVHYEGELGQKQVEFTSEQKQIELEIAKSFFNLSKKARIKIQQKIPIKILKRLQMRLSESNENDTLTNLQL